MQIMIYDNEGQFKQLNYYLQKCLSQERFIYHIDIINHQDFSYIKENYDIAFMINDSTCLDKIKTLQKKQPQCLIYFIAEDYSYIYEAFQLHIFQYLILPIQFSLFEQEFKRCLYECRQKNYHFIFHTNKGKRFFQTKDILYVETYYNELKIVTLDDTFRTNIKQRPTLKKHLSSIHFMKIQRSFLVNLSHILSIEKDYIIMDNHQELPLSSRKKVMILDEYQKYNHPYLPTPHIYTHQHEKTLNQF